MASGRYSSSITKPPEGLGVRLVSAGPFSFQGFRPVFLLLALAACATPGSRGSALHPDVTVVAAERRVEIRGRVACTRGFLEQVACGRGTREHESLVMVEAPASVVHAALLAAGARPGRPGQWASLPGGSVRADPPQGDPITIRVRWSEAGVCREAPIEAWIRGLEPDAARWVFAGSRFAQRQGVERYVADDSGSLVGLVTFGDEVVALRQVVPDRAEVKAPAFRANTSAMPPEGDPVTLILRASP